MKKATMTLVTFLMGMFVASSAFAQWQRCDIRGIDIAASQLDEAADHLHEDLHNLANYRQYFTRLDAAASALHDAAHHLHETAHYEQDCGHLRVDFQEVDYAYSQLRREWSRASFRLIGQRHIQQVYREVEYAFSRLSRLMYGHGGHNHGGIGGGHFDIGPGAPFDDLRPFAATEHAPEAAHLSVAHQ